MDPTIALAIPPPCSPTGFGVCVRNAQLIDPIPRYIKYPKIATNGASTTSTVRIATPVMRWSVKRRRRLIGGTGAMALISSRDSVRGLAAGHSPNQQPRQGIHDNRDQEKSEPDLYQSSQVS